MSYTGSFDANLSALQQKVALKKQLEAKLAELLVQRDVFDKQVLRLWSEHRSEQLDVEKLEGKSLAAYFYQFFGKLDEKIDEERREAAAAKVKLDAAKQELAAVDHDIQQIQAQLQELSGCERAYSDALEEKRNALRSSGTPAAARILELEEQLALAQIRSKEIREAICAGRSALEAANSVLDALKEAGRWNTWDAFGGGVIAHISKHEVLDYAQAEVGGLQRDLCRFQAELADIHIEADLRVTVDGFLRFADYFFDSLFVDWMVGDQISQSQTSVETVKRQISEALEKLEGAGKDADDEISRLESTIEELLLNG